MRHHFGRNTRDSIQHPLEVRRASRQDDPVSLDDLILAENENVHEGETIPQIHECLESFLPVELPS